MSYILDALRKADAERERDPARGIHAQPAALQTGHRGAGRLWPWAIVAAVLVASAAIYLLRPAPPALPVAVPVPPPAAVAVAPMPAPPAQVAAAAATPVTPAAEVQPPAPPMPAPPPAAAAPAVRPAPAPAPAAAAAASKAAATPPASAPAAPAAERAVPFAELPPDVQRELPKLAIQGGVHSENASQRMLIVGGQVMHEGAELAPGVVLEQIRPKAAVLRFRTWRYTLPY